MTNIFRNTDAVTTHTAPSRRALAVAPAPAPTPPPKYPFEELNLGDQLFVLNEKSLSKGHSLSDVLIKAAQDFFGIDIRPSADEVTAMIETAKGNDPNKES